jgi:outer membrane protein TolC
MEAKRGMTKSPPALCVVRSGLGSRFANESQNGGPLSPSNPPVPGWFAFSCATARRNLLILLAVFILAQIAGCVSDKVGDDSVLTSYQQGLVDKGPQQRIDTEGKDPMNPLGLLSPAPETAPPKLEVTTDPDTGRQIYSLAIEEAVARTLANSPEIRIVSFDPSIARQEITKAAAEFDVIAFGRVNYEKEDNPVNSALESSQSNTRLTESGIKQKGITGSQWALSYLLTRTWDDLTYSRLSTRYEPILAFQIKQPLLRDAWEKVNLAGVNIARLNHEVALAGFRQKAEDISTEVISIYWLLLQARRDLEIQQQLLDRTLDTLRKVQGRKEIDATAVQIKQTEASVKAREAVLVQAKKRITDVQDALIRLMADPQMNLLGESEIVPVTSPDTTPAKLEPSELLKLAVKNNPAVEQARIALLVADINIDVAKNQQMPRLDLVASARSQGLARGESTARDSLNTGDYASYALGFSLEYPLGNRQRKAELLRRKLERSKAVSTLQNIADQVATAVRERIRKVQTSHAQIQIQQDAFEAAGIHLQALEDTEPIRERLTPEFLLVKLQAQEALADSERAEAKAIADFNISLAELARTTGTVLELHEVRTALPVASAQTGISDQTAEAEQ